MTLEEKGFTVSQTVTNSDGIYEQLIKMISARKCEVMYRLRRSTSKFTHEYTSEEFTDHHLFTR